MCQDLKVRQPQIQSSLNLYLLCDCRNNYKFEILFAFLALNQLNKEQAYVHERYRHYQNLRAMDHLHALDPKKFSMNH